MEKQTYTVNQFIEAFNVGRTTTYQEIDSGRLKTYKLGRRRYISATAASEWQCRLEAETSQAAAQGSAS